MTLALAPPAPLLQAVQSIGNLGQQLGQGKEMWMAPLHPFLLQSISRVRDFLDQLVDVDGEEGEFLWPCHIWLITPLDPGDLPFLFLPPPRSTETVGQLVSQLTFSAPYCAFPANAEMWMGTGAWYSCNRQISIKYLLCNRRCSRCWGHGSERDRRNSCSNGNFIPGETTGCKTNEQIV